MAYSIQIANDFAKHYKGKCLNKEYVSVSNPLKWQCVKGHTWDAPLSLIKQGSWCSQCSKQQSKSDTLNIYKEIAKAKGGKCLSKEYINSQSKLLFKCAKGHEFYSRAEHVKGSRAWCSICSGKKKLTIEDMQTIASKKGGVCLSKKYIDNTTKLKWKCAKGHTWYAEPVKVKYITWCPHYDCRYNSVREKLKADINDLRKFAKLIGGRLISKEYKNSNSPLEWECKNKHRFILTANAVKNDLVWCSECNPKRVDKTSYKKRVKNQLLNK